MAGVQQVLERAVEEGVVPGAVALVARGDEVWSQAYGAMSLGGPPMRTDAIMRIQSMTKPLTTVAALLAVQEGRLSLADPVTRWLPELSDRTVLCDVSGPLEAVEPARRDITVRDLLVNGSGYGICFGDTPMARAMTEAGVAVGVDPPQLPAQEWLRRLAALPLVGHPGEVFRYHHSFALLGILLQRLAGEPLETHLRQVLFEPLGMVDTGLSVPAGQEGRLPAAYRHGEGGALEQTEPLGGGFYVGPPPFDTAHGELVSTAADFHRFARMLADGGRVGGADGRDFLSPQLVAEVTRDQVPGRVKTADSFFPGFWDGMGWGYGVGVEIAGARTGRYGWSGGQGTDWFTTPDGRIGLLLTQVELGAQTWGLISDFSAAAG